MSELRQFHPSLEFQRSRNSNNKFLIIRDTPRDTAVLQSENKVKPSRGQNVSSSLPKADRTAKAESKTLVLKEVPTEASEKDFKELLDLNKIIYAKAERLTSKNNGRAHKMFKFAKSNLSHYRHNLQGGGISVSSFSTVVLKLPKFWPFGKNIKTKCLICGESHHHKGCPDREKKQPKCPNCKGPHVASYKGCPAYKKQAFRQHLVDDQKSCAAILCQSMALPQPQDKKCTVSAEQLVKFVANMAIQVTQPQVS